jgi:hypothetical protein
MLRNFCLGNIAVVCSSHRFSPGECKFGNTSENFSSAACLPVYVQAFSSRFFLKAAGKCDFVGVEMILQSAIYLSASHCIFINVQLLYSKIR